MKNPMSFRFSQFLNDVLQNRLARLLNSIFHCSFGVKTSILDTELNSLIDLCIWFVFFFLNIFPGSWMIMMLKYKRMF